MSQGGWNPPPGGGPGGYPQQQPGGYQQPAQQVHSPQMHPPQGHYPGPPAANPGPGGIGGVGGKPNAQEKGFFAGLFDFSFETFVALKVIKVMYGLFLILLALGVLGGLGASVVTMVQGEVLAGLGILIALPIVAILYLVLGRVYFELVVVAFKIAEDADEIARNTRK
jgi:hypothetical protein